MKKPTRKNKMSDLTLDQIDEERAAGYIPRDEAIALLGGTPNSIPAFASRHGIASRKRAKARYYLAADVLRVLDERAKETKALALEAQQAARAARKITRKTNAR